MRAESRVGCCSREPGAASDADDVSLQRSQGREAARAIQLQRVSNLQFIEQVAATHAVGYAPNDELPLPFVVAQIAHRIRSAVLDDTDIGAENAEEGHQRLGAGRCGCCSEDGEC